MTTDDDITVVIVDDNYVVRMGLSMVLESAPGIVVIGEADSGEAAVASVQQLHPDVVLLDVRMPGSFDGVVAAGMIAPLAKVIMLTQAKDDVVIRQAMANGAMGYLVHGSTPADEIIAAIRIVNDGRHYLAGDAAESLVRAVTEPDTPAAHHESTVRAAAGLTAREIEIMDLIATGANNQNIAAQLFIAPSTLKNHITRIFTKIGVQSRAEAIVTWLESAPPAGGHQMDHSGDAR